MAGRLAPHERECRRLRMGLRLCLSPRALGSGPSALGRCPGVSGCLESSAGDHIHAAPFGDGLLSQMRWGVGGQNSYRLGVPIPPRDSCSALLINGNVGAGKTSVAEMVGDQLTNAGVPNDMREKVPCFSGTWPGPGNWTPSWKQPQSRTSRLTPPT